MWVGIGILYKSLCAYSRTTGAHQLAHKHVHMRRIFRALFRETCRHMWRRAKLETLICSSSVRELRSVSSTSSCGDVCAGKLVGRGPGTYTSLDVELVKDMIPA